MSKRTEALTRELAALFVKYRAADWAPILDEIEGSRRSAALSAAITDLLAKARAKSKARPKAATRKSPNSNSEQGADLVHPERFAVLEAVRRALASKEVLATTGMLREAFVAIGMKDPPGARRDDMVKALLRHLDGVNDDQFPPTLRLLQDVARRSTRDPAADYAEWFRIIASGRERTEPPLR